MYYFSEVVLILMTLKERRQNDERCSVKTYELYIPKHHQQLDALCQRPLGSFREDNTVWYVKILVGENIHIM